MILNFDILYMMKELIDHKDYTNLNVILHNQYKNNIEVPKCIYDSFLKENNHYSIKYLFKQYFRNYDSNSYSGILKMLIQYGEDVYDEFYHDSGDGTFVGCFEDDIEMINFIKDKRPDIIDTYFKEYTESHVMVKIKNEYF